MTNFTKGELERLRQTMLERQRILTDEVKAKRGSAASEDNVEATGGVGDGGDESVARMITDLDLQEAGRDLDELRDIGAALGRMDDGSYGLCAECGGAIDPRRLDAQPAALRCLKCQTQHEKMYAHKNTPTL